MNVPNDEEQFYDINSYFFLMKLSTNFFVPDVG